VNYLNHYQSARTAISRTTILANYQELFKMSKTLKKDYDGINYIEAHLSDINFKETEDLPVHFYSDLPKRMESVWDNLQKRNVKTLIEYMKSMGSIDNPVITLSKISQRGNRYFVFTTKSKYMNMRNRYKNYSIETI
jgi:hypothetical protein